MKSVLKKRKVIVLHSPKGAEKPIWVPERVVINMDPTTEPEAEPEPERLSMAPSIVVPKQKIPFKLRRRQRGKKKKGAIKSTLRVNPPTWGQIQNLASKAEVVIESQGVPETPATMFMAMLAVLSCQSDAVSSDPSSNTSK